MSLRARQQSYCPRCTSKARHRTVWHHLREHTSFWTERLRVLHVSPSYSLSRNFVRLPNLQYIGADINPNRNISTLLDLTHAPFKANAFDVLIAVHVLEHIDRDRDAIGEIYRLLDFGGWALIGVPTCMESLTFEDPTIDTPQGRKSAFGEADHVRLYGKDIVQRLEEPGFRVEIYLGDSIEHPVRTRFGLRDDENLFICRKKEMDR